MTNRLRLLSTHDFFGSLAPVPTSYGSLSGGEGLRATIEQLRSDTASLWIDTGDAVQGGPLTPLTRGRGGYAAIAELGIDAAVVGNHELDFGIECFNRDAAQLGFPVLGANAGFGPRSRPACAARPRRATR